MHGSQYWSLVQFTGLSRSYEVGAGRRGCCTYLLYCIPYRTAPPLRRHHPSPAEFAAAPQQAASARAASIVSAHTAGQIVSVVTVLAADQPAAVAIALAVASDTLKRPGRVVHPLMGQL